MIDKSQRRTSDALPNSLASAGCSSLAGLTRVWVLVLLVMMPTTTLPRYYSRLRCNDGQGNQVTDADRTVDERASKQKTGPSRRV